RRIVYLPEIKVYHVGGGTLPNKSPFKLFLNYRNNLLLLYKNLPKNKTFSTIFSRMVLDGISAIIYLLKFDFSYFWAVVKAHFAFYKLLTKFKGKRKILLKNNKEHSEIYKKSIIFDYFFRKKSKFTQLQF
ncbi:MAG: glycosyltransferase family 2 protein, partial [Bacteroidota bacterium]|nr:glycosyltransferase family 2 protein [Bacteroidota bacterium]